MILSSFLTTLEATSNIANNRSIMRRTFTYRLFAVITAIAVIALASAALAHSHPRAKTADESHCGICLSAHSVRAGLTSPPVSLHFVPIVSGFSVQIVPIAFVSIQSRPAQDRAPPAA